MSACLYCCACNAKIDGAHIVLTKALYEHFGAPLTYCNHCGAVGVTISIRENQLSARVIALERTIARERAEMDKDLHTLEATLKFASGLIF